MSETIKLPPIPPEWSGLWDNGGRIRYCTEHMQIYARWAVEQNIKTLQSELSAALARAEKAEAKEAITALGRDCEKVRAEKAEAERDAALAKVARYETLRPASEHDGKAFAVRYVKDDGQYAPITVDDDNFLNCPFWTPLPDVKEAKP